MGGAWPAGVRGAARNVQVTSSTETQRSSEMVTMSNQSRHAGTAVGGFAPGPSVTVVKTYLELEVIDPEGEELATVRLPVTGSVFPINEGEEVEVRGFRGRDGELNVKQLIS